MWFTILATAYCACSLCTFGFGFTASGAWPIEGVTVACPQAIPIGTVVDIAGIGRRVCEDRGGAITTGRLDIYMQSHGAALRFGVQRREVRVVRPDGW